MTGPEDFARAFSAAFATGEGAAIAALCRDDAAALTLTGGWAEGRAEIAARWTADLEGPLSGSRLVTGKGRLTLLAPGVALLHQRFVLTGLVDADGAELARLAVMLTAVLLEEEGDCLARSLVLAALS